MIKKNIRALRARTHAENGLSTVEKGERGPIPELHIYCYDNMQRNKIYCSYAGSMVDQNK